MPEEPALIKGLELSVTPHTPHPPKGEGLEVEFSHQQPVTSSVTVM